MAYDLWCIYGLFSMIDGDDQHALTVHTDMVLIGIWCAGAV